MGEQTDKEEQKTFVVISLRQDGGEHKLVLTKKTSGNDKEEETLEVPLSKYYIGDERRIGCQLGEVRFYVNFDQAGDCKITTKVGVFDRDSEYEKGICELYKVVVANEGKELTFQTEAFHETVKLDSFKVANQEKTSISVKLNLEGEPKLLLEQKSFSGKIVKAREIKLSDYDFSDNKKLQVDLCMNEYIRSAVVGCENGEYKLFSYYVPITADGKKAKLEIQEQGCFTIESDQVKYGDLQDKKPESFDEPEGLDKIIPTVKPDFSKFIDLLVGEKNPGRVGFTSKLEKEKQLEVQKVKGEFKIKLDAALTKFANKNSEFADFISKEDNLAAKEKLASDVMLQLYKSGGLKDYGKFKHVGSGADIITRFVEAVVAVINRVFGDGKLYQDWSESRTKFEVHDNAIKGKIVEAVDKVKFDEIFKNIASSSKVQVNGK